MANLYDEGNICEICLQILQLPLNLPCNHVFCYLCLKGQVGNTCPTCETPYDQKLIQKPEIRTFVPESHKKPVWLYKTSNAFDIEWWLYDDRTNDIIEKAHQAKEDQLEVKILNKTFKIDLKNKTQSMKNDPNRPMFDPNFLPFKIPFPQNKVRRIQRLEANDYQYTATGLMGLPVLNIIGKAGVLKRRVIEWKFEAPRWTVGNRWTNFKPEIARILETEHKRVMINGKGKSEDGDLVEISAIDFYDNHGSKKEHKFIVDFVDMEIYRKTGFREMIKIKRVDPNKVDNKKTSNMAGLTLSGIPSKK